jgi:hypothetical protein
MWIERTLTGAFGLCVSRARLSRSQISPIRTIDFRIGAVFGYGAPLLFLALVAGQAAGALFTGGY